MALFLEKLELFFIFEPPPPYWKIPTFFLNPSFSQIDEVSITFNNNNVAPIEFFIGYGDRAAFNEIP